MNHRDFDEVMIVNPSPPGFDPVQGDESMMAYGEPVDGMGYYADDYDGYGDAYGWSDDPDDFDDDGDDFDDDYDEEMEMGWAGPPYGFAAPPGYAEGYPVDPALLGGWGGPVAYGYAPLGHAPHGYASLGHAPLGYAPLGHAPLGHAPLGYAPHAYAGYAGQPAMPGYGWGEYADVAGYAYGAPWGYAVADDYDDYDDDYDDYDDDYDDYDDEDDYAYAGDIDAEYDGYVRDVPPSFNPVVTSAAHLGGWHGGLAGYRRPETVSPSCGSFTPQPGSPVQLPETLQPLW